MAGEKGAAPMEDEYKSFLAELGGKDPRAAGGESSRPGLGSGEDMRCCLGLQGPQPPAPQGPPRPGPVSSGSWA